MTANHMRIRPLSLAFATILAATFLFNGTAMAASKQDVPETTPEGLKLVKNEKHRLVYLADDVDFGVYSKVYIVDAAVAFAKNWQRDYNRQERDLSRKVSDKDVERIKNSLSAEFKKVFTQTMIDNGLEVVTELGPDVVVLRPAIINLVVNAPDIQGTTRSYTFTADAGQMTLYLEVYDGVSGALLAEVMDAKSARRTGPNMSYSTRTTNIQEADRMLKSWANEIAGHFNTAKETDAERDAGEAEEAKAEG
jgi:hypothetical protein